MNDLDELKKTYDKLKTQLASQLDKHLTPEILAEMTPEQREMVKQGKNDFSMEGKTDNEKLDHLQKIMRNVSSFNK